MSFFADAGRNSFIHTGFIDTFTYVSMHTANPGTTGANEATGGSYARQLHGLTGPSAGQVSNPALIHFPCLDGVYWWVGFWSAVTAGTYGGSVALGAKPLRAVTVSSTGSVFGSANHGLANGTTVVVHDIIAAGLPTGFTAGTIYYVISSTTNTFQLSTSGGGSAVTTTSDTEVFLQEIASVTATGGTGVDFNIGKLIVDATLI